MKNRSIIQKFHPLLGFAFLVSATVTLVGCSDDDDDNKSTPGGGGNLPAAPTITNNADEATISSRGTEQTAFAAEVVSGFKSVLGSESSSLTAAPVNPGYALTNPLQNLQTLASASGTMGAVPEVPDGLDSLVEDPQGDTQCRHSLDMLDVFADFQSALSAVATIGQIQAQTAATEQFVFTKNEPAASEAINYTVKTSDAFASQSGSTIETVYSSGSDDSTFFFRQSSNFRLDLSKFFEALKNALSKIGGTNTDQGEGFTGLSGTTTGSMGTQVEAKPREKKLSLYQQSNSNSTVSFQGRNVVSTSSGVRTVEVDGNAGLIKISNEGSFNLNGTNVTYVASHQVSKKDESSLVFDFSWDFNKSGTAKSFSGKMTITRNESGTCQATIEGAINPEEIEEFASPQ